MSCAMAGEPTNSMPSRQDGSGRGLTLKLKRSQLARRRRDWEPDPITSGFPDCWIMVELSARPARRRVVHGAGSIAVARG